MNLRRAAVAAVFLLLAAAHPLMIDSKPAQASCAPQDTSKGTVTQTVNIPTTGTYNIWSRIIAPDTDSNSYYLEIDGTTCGINIGDSAITPNTWTWVDYKDGNSASKVSLNLTAGNHSVVMIGREAGVKLDRILFLQDGCVPDATGTGDNCTPDITSPTVSIAAPANNAIVYGSIQVNATASDDVGVSRVEFFVDGVLKNTDTTSPYGFTWNTSEVSDGSHSLTATAYDAANNTGTSAAIMVTVDQSAVPPRSSNGLTALYEFKEGSGTAVNDTSGNGSPLNLTILDTTKIQWLTGENGVNITSPGSGVKSSVAATKIIDASKASGQVTLEAWVTPANSSQSGPSRIATLSEGINSNQVNLHLGQDGTSGSYRIRTSNNTFSNLAVPSVFTNTATPTHVILTYDSTVQRMYVNGVLQPTTVSPGGNLTNWDSVYPLTFGNEASLDRSWLGKVHLVAFYNRALPDAEVQQNFGAGPSSGTVPGPAPDTQAPSVNVTAPLNGDTVNGTTVNITADAQDNKAVTKVEFMVDGIVVNTDTAAPYNYSWDSTTVSNGSHSITAKAFDVAGNSASSSSVSVTVQNGDTQPPVAPTLSATAPAHNQVSLTWNKPADNVGVVGYYVVRSTSGGPFTTIAQPINITSYLDNSVIASTSYSYKLIAYDAAGNNSPYSNTVTLSTPSAPDTQPPATPGNFTATAINSSQVNLSWTSSDNTGIKSYDIYRGVGAAVPSKLITITTSATSASYGDTGLSPSTSYSYYIIATDAAGNVSSKSETRTVTTPVAVTVGNITGVVSSSGGGVVSGAKVTLKVNGVNRTYSTNSSGAYTVTGLPADTYSVQFSAKRHRTQTQSVTVTAGATITKNITLQAR